MLGDRKSESVDEHVRKLRAAIEERAAAEDRIESSYGGSTEALDAKSGKLIAAIEQTRDDQDALDHEEFEQSRDEASGRCETEYNAVASAMQSALDALDRTYKSESTAIESERDDARWMVTSVLDDDADDSPKRKLKVFQTQLSAIRDQLQSDDEEIQESFREVSELLQKRKQWWEVSAATVVEAATDRQQAYDRIQDTTATVRKTISRLKRRPLSRLLAGWNLLVLLVVVWGAGAGGLHAFVDPTASRMNLPRDPAVWILMVAAAALVPAVVVGSMLYSVNRSRVARLLRQLRQQMAELSGMHQQWRAFAKRELDGQQQQYKHWQAEFARDRKKALGRIETDNAGKLADVEEQYRKTRDETVTDFDTKLQEIIARRDVEIQRIDAQFTGRAQESERDRGREIEEVRREYETLKTQRSSEEDFERGAAAETWLNGLADFSTSIERCNAMCEETSPGWDDIADDQWKIGDDVPSVICFGHFDCDLSKLPDGQPRDERLRPQQSQFHVPAMLSFPDHGSLLYKTTGDGRAAAVESMRNVMLRFLTSLPAGKVRFTVLDPAGLGEAFSAFMHLADYDELMIGSRIWTEPSQIDKKLTELSEHMENVFQAYLRNEFETIDQYNQQAGEVAEPYHVLVVTNFPSNFSESAARRLTNIATSGSRCGVYTLISVDTSQPLPHKFDLADLERHAMTVRWKKDRFIAVDPDLRDLPLTLDAPPWSRDFTKIVHSAGRQSENARKVEVAFARVAPKDDQFWTGDSRAEIEVPLGRAGATKLQSLRLGKGTSQHVLVAGKTGSGKSTFLHALITNLALHYGPDQIEFFLIDFKKGVEFKTYATHKLPHARIIGIESDREFGVSVLQRLDAILKERGNLFREFGVQDLHSYRDAQPQATLPRILLVIDEFQEFFVEDDALAGTASLLLDRLVRQGRAFGIHVLLGSQTLGGAYSLARSTLGQVAVRIALQCSESDAHLILSEENTAARLLTRPGEAIYNDANGLLEGNHPFQIAWLPDDEREVYLKRLQSRVEADGRTVEPPIVFEGHVASDSRRNKELTRLIADFATGQKSADSSADVTPRIWLGESVSIGSPPQMSFHRRPGDNLLIVGQDDVAARGLLSTALIALAAQQKLSAESTSFYILAGEAVSAETDGENLATWNRWADAIPHTCKIAGQREAGELIRIVAAEVERRAASDNGETAAPVFVLISDLSRFRDLRGERDDYGFSMDDSDKPKSAGSKLADILADGPAVGVHCLIWCDTYGNLNRWMTMSTQREFEAKIAFRMNGADSSNLIDTPAASRLGDHRALLYRGDSGSIEKFRPYAPPDDKWLERIANQLHGREDDMTTWDDVGMLSVT